ncbi:MAG: DUF58 domain-containing protein [Bdellovibrio sp.]|nr:MAG: DUF58 domain-containing protein [Bdellovibrio sp.]
MKVPSEVLEKVKLLELVIRKRVNSFFAGQYHSAFKGQGMTFSEFREYVPGDDVRSISWPLMAKTGKIYIKKFDEERENILMLAVDISGSTDFGSQKYPKGEVMAHVAAALGFCAVKNGDPVGLVLFSDQVEHVVPPKKGRSHLLRILRDLYFFKPYSHQTKISVALEFLQGILKKRSHVFLISDFVDKDYTEPLRMASKKHDIIAVQVQDPLEEETPPLGLVDWEDPETGEHQLIDLSSPLVRRFFKEEALKVKQQIAEDLKRSQVDCIQVRTDQDFIDPLLSYFKRRALR